MVNFFLVLHTLPDTLPLANVVDDITANEVGTEYHPKGHRGAKAARLEANGPHHSTPFLHCSDDSAVHDPWWPFFNTREDFILAELLSEGHISKDLSDKLIKLFHHCFTGKGKLTITSVADIDAAWQRASSTLTPVSSRMVRT